MEPNSSTTPRGDRNRSWSSKDQGAFPTSGLNPPVAKAGGTFNVEFTSSPTPPKLDKWQGVVGGSPAVCLRTHDVGPKKTPLGDQISVFRDAATSEKSSRAPELSWNSDTTRGFMYINNCRSYRRTYYCTESGRHNSQEVRGRNCTEKSSRNCPISRNQECPISRKQECRELTRHNCTDVGFLPAGASRQIKEKLAYAEPQAVEQTLSWLKVARPFSIAEENWPILYKEDAGKGSDRIEDRVCSTNSAQQGGVYDKQKWPSLKESFGNGHGHVYDEHNPMYCYQDAKRTLQPELGSVLQKRDASEICSTKSPSSQSWINKESVSGKAIQEQKGKAGYTQVNVRHEQGHQANNGSPAMQEEEQSIKGVFECENMNMPPVLLMLNKDFIVTSPLKQNLLLTLALTERKYVGEADDGESVRSRELERRQILVGQFTALSSFLHFMLGRDAKRVRTESNAGGTSTISESLSVEYFVRRFQAKDIVTEMEVEYCALNWKKVDYICTLYGQRVGVSVTRAMSFPHPAEFSSQMAYRLLYKKLFGLVVARHGVSKRHNFSQCILHVWCETQHTALIMQQEYEGVAKELDITDDVIMVLTVADGWHARPIFYESILKTLAAS